MKIEVVADYACEIGENPLWHPRERQLYWCSHDNTTSGRLFQFDPERNTHDQIHEGGYIGGFTFQSDGDILLFKSEGEIGLWNGKEIYKSFTVDLNDKQSDSLFNDVISDPKGRVFCGVRYPDERHGGLYRLDKDGNIIQIEDNIEVPNGLGFDPELQHLYFTDTGPENREIYVYDYDVRTGKLSNRKVFTEIPGGEREGLPDGLTVDADGYIWSARVFNGALVRYRPDGIEDQRIELPTRDVTSLAFGGDSFTEIYATTAGGQNKEKHGENAGALFRIDLEIKGKPEFFSEIAV